MADLDGFARTEGYERAFPRACDPHDGNENVIWSFFNQTQQAHIESLRDATYPGARPPRKFFGPGVEAWVEDFGLLRWTRGASKHIVNYVTEDSNAGILNLRKRDILFRLVDWSCRSDLETEIQYHQRYWGLYHFLIPLRRPLWDWMKRKITCFVLAILRQRYSPLVYPKTPQKRHRIICIRISPCQGRLTRRCPIHIYGHSVW